MRISDRQIENRRKAIERAATAAGRLPVAVLQQERAADAAAANSSSNAPQTTSSQSSQEEAENGEEDEQDENLLSLNEEQHIAMPPLRKRGRPRKDAALHEEQVLAEAAAVAAEARGAPRKRGRPRKNAATPAASAATPLRDSTVHLPTVLHRLRDRGVDNITRRLQSGHIARSNEWLRRRRRML